MNTCLVTDALMSTKLTAPECRENEGSACRVLWLTALPLKSSFKENLNPLSNNCWWVGFPHEILRYLFADARVIPYLPFALFFFFFFLFRNCPFKKIQERRD